MYKRDRKAWREGEKYYRKRDKIARERERERSMTENHDRKS